MTFTFQPARVATSSDEECMLVSDEKQRLLAVLTRLGNQYGGALATGIRNQALARSAE